MTKKRIAVDIDLCGNSVENVTNISASGKITGNLDGALLDAESKRAIVAALPYYNRTTFGFSGSQTDDVYIQALLKKIVSDHKDLLGKTLVGMTEPNNQRYVILYTYYPTQVVNEMPRYCSGVMYTGYRGDEYRFWIDDGVFGSKTISNASGEIICAKADHLGNTISDTYAKKNSPVGVVAYENNLKFGTGSVADSVNPVDMALIQECSANRFAFIPPECIAVEYSRDAGATWLDYGASDADKRRLVTNFGAAVVYIGGPDASNSNPADANCRLRITIKQAKSGLYANLHKFYLWVSTYGSTNCWCKIYVRTNASASNESGWISITDNAKISGWSGPNIINTGAFTFGSSAGHYGEIRFEFGATGHTGSAYPGLGIFNIFAYTQTAWTYPTVMAKTGHLYAYDYAQNATFPNGVKAKQFTGDLVGVAQKATNDGDGNKISETYAHGVSLYDADGEFVETAKTIENGYLKLQNSADIQVNQSKDSDGKDTIEFSLTDAAKRKMGVERVCAYGVPDSDGIIAPENRDIIFPDSNHVLNVISSDSVYVDASSVTLDVDPQESVNGIRMSVRLAPKGGLESTSAGLKVSQSADEFFVAPKIVFRRMLNDNGTYKYGFQISHPCDGKDGVEFVLMNKSKRTQRGDKTTSKKTKHRKGGWTVALNFRRAALSYGETQPSPYTFDTYTALVAYVKKYYMYPARTTSTTVDTTSLDLTDLYFGGWGITTHFRRAKEFGIAARRLKNGRYEYSQTAVFCAHVNNNGVMTFGVK